MDINVMQIVLMDDLIRQLRRLNEGLTALPAPARPVTVITQAAALPSAEEYPARSSVQPHPALPAADMELLPQPTGVLPVGAEETRRFLLQSLAGASFAVQKLSADFQEFKDDFTEYAEERRARGRLVADTETITASGRTIEIEGGMMYFRATNKGTRYGLYVMINDQYPGEWRGPGEVFEASFPTRAIVRARMFCNIDESTQVEYFGLF